MFKSNKLTFLLTGVAFILPLFALADYGYFTMPLAASDTNGISSWFDHSTPLGLGDASTSILLDITVLYTQEHRPKKIYAIKV